MALGNRKTLLPDSLVDWHRPGVPLAPSTLPKIPESEEDVKTEVHNPKKHVLEKRLRKTNNATESRVQELSLRRESPAQKYWTCHKFNQAGVGWISFESKAGLEMVFIKAARSEPKGRKVRLQETDHVNVVNLIEAFLFNQTTWLVYSFNPFDISLSVLCATPNLEMGEADIATICRDILKGLQYIHTELKLSHGSINRKNILFSHSGQIKIANIGDGMLLGNSLEGKRDDLKSVGLIAIHLQNPSTILEDDRILLHNPQNMTEQAKSFIEMTPTATYTELFQCEFMLKAAPEGAMWSLKPLYMEAFPYSERWNSIRGGCKDW